MASGWDRKDLTSSANSSSYSMSSISIFSFVTLSFLTDDYLFDLSPPPVLEVAFSTSFNSTNGGGLNRKKFLLKLDGSFLYDICPYFYNDITFKEKSLSFFRSSDATLPDPIIAYALSSGIEESKNDCDRAYRALYSSSFRDIRS